MHQKTVKIPDLVPKLERVYSRGYDEADEDVYSPSDLEIIREASSVIEIDSEVEKEEEYEPFEPKFVSALSLSCVLDLIHRLSSRKFGRCRRLSQLDQQERTFKEPSRRS